MTRLATRYRPQPIAEIDIHIAVADLLRRTCNPRRWVWTHIGHGGKRSIETGQLMKRLGQAKGWPDFIFIAWTGHVYFLELKRETGVLDDDQRIFHRTMHAWNIECRVARSIEEAIRILGSWGVVPVRTEDVA